MTQTPTGRTCPKCGGTGYHEDYYMCADCNGTGQEYADLPEADAPPAVREPEDGE